MQKDFLVFALLIVGVGVFFGIIYRIGATLSRKALANMRTLAERLKISVVEKPSKFGIHDYPEAAGTMRGKQVRLFNYTTGSGKSKTTWSAIAVTPTAHGGLTFALSREGIGSKMMSLFGAKEIKVGDKFFDDKWYVRSNAPEFFAAALLPEIREKIMAAPGGWKLQEGIVIYSERGMFSDTARCERFAPLTGAACDLADIAEVYAKQA